MTEGDRDSSGELSSFLHLTGWRPLVLALIAGLAGAVGLFGALNSPAEWQARYILSVNAAADDDLTPAQLDIFVDEIVQAARLPRVASAIEEATGLIEEDDYKIAINQSPSSTSTIDINVVTARPEDAEAIAIEAGVTALTITLEDTINGLESNVGQLETSRRSNDERIQELTIEAKFNPATAYELATRAIVEREIWRNNPPTCADETGAQFPCPEPSPPLEQLRAEAARLEPLNREYERIISVVDSQTVKLEDLRSSLGESQAALDDLEDERENPEVLQRVVTEETSRIAGLLTGLLLFAVPAALLVIFAFVIFDALRKKPAAEPLRRADDFTPAGVLEAQGQRALPEAARVPPLTVVDEDVAPPTEAHPVVEDVLEAEAELDTTGGDDEPKAKKRSKDGRWGRDASSKAG